jgi:hypothetical protein
VNKENSLNLTDKLQLVHHKFNYFLNKISEIKLYFKDKSLYKISQMIQYFNYHSITKPSLLKSKKDTHHNIIFCYSLKKNLLDTKLNTLPNTNKNSHLNILNKLKQNPKSPKYNSYTSLHNYNILLIRYFG